MRILLDGSNGEARNDRMRVITKKKDGKEKEGKWAKRLSKICWGLKEICLCGESVGTVQQFKRRGDRKERKSKCGISFPRWYREKH